MILYKFAEIYKMAFYKICYGQNIIEANKG